MTIVDGLSTPYGVRGNASLERLRSAAMTAAKPGGSDLEKANYLFSWALKGELRALFVDQVPSPEALADGSASGEFARALDAAAPSVLDLAAAMPYANVGTQTMELLRAFISSDFPHKRVEGYCALLCVCAARRKF